MKILAVRTCAALALTCFIVATLMLCLPAATVHAQGDGDRNLAEKKGMEGLFKGKGIDANDPRLAKPWQKYLALGSVAVTVVLWKFL